MRIEMVSREWLWWWEVETRRTIQSIFYPAAKYFTVRSFVLHSEQMLSTCYHKTTPSPCLTTATVEYVVVFAPLPIKVLSFLCNVLLSPLYVQRRQRSTSESSILMQLELLDMKICRMPHVLRCGVHLHSSGLLNPFKKYYSEILILMALKELLFTQFPVSV